jgi:uncharacterized protein (TIGR02453 family)
VSFTGIPDEALEFYEGLEADNTKTYWAAHKHVYDTQVRAPMVALCDELAPEFGDVRLFRPHRDVRFAKDKSPYKVQQGASVGSYYLQISATGMFVATGYYRMASDQVAKYRVAVDDDAKGRDLESRVASIRDKGYDVTGDMLKTRPRGYPADHPRLDLLRHRSLVAWLEMGAPDWLTTPAAVPQVATAWRDLTPLREWLDDYVGPSAEPPR